MSSASWLTGLSSAAQAQGDVEHVLVAAEQASALPATAKLWHDYGSFALYRMPKGSLKALTAAGVTGIKSADDHRLLFGAYPFDTQRDTVRSSGVVGLSTPFGASLHVVQFVGPVKQEWLDRIRATGASIVHYVANNGYVVWADAAARAELSELRSQGDFVQYSDVYHAMFKIGPELGRRISGSALGSDRFPVMIQMYSHSDEADTQQFLAERGKQLVDWSPILAYKNAKFELTADEIAEIAQRPDVFWMEVVMPRSKNDEVQNQILASEFDGPQSGPSGPGYLAWLAARGFTQAPSDYPVVDVTDDGIGEGVIDTDDATLHELGIVGAIPTDSTRLTYVQSCFAVGGSGEGVDGHGHINTSIVGGYDNRSGFPFQDPDGFNFGLGVSPYGRMGGTRIFAPGFGQDGCGGNDTGVIQAVAVAGAQISNNSWGCSGCAASYDEGSQAYDAGTRDGNPALAGHQPIIQVFSAGNSGPGAATVGTPGNGKNMITVGASENDRPTWTDGCGTGPTGADNAMDVIAFSSRGPSPGGRTKPEVIAPGTHIQGTASSNPGYNGSGVCGGTGGASFHPPGQTEFTSSSGTSHSGPAVAGVISLLWHWAAQGRVPVNGVGAATGVSPALAKAYLMAHPTYLTGVSGGGNLPTNSQGYGMPDMERMFDDADRVILDQSTILDNTGETHVVNANVEDNGRPIRIALAYTDAPGATGVSPQVNNLDLEVTHNGNTYRGNRFTGQFSTPGAPTADAVNNYEAVFLPAGTTGPITITVRGTNIAGNGVPNVGDGTDQDFALVCYNCEGADPTFGLGASPSAVQACGTDGSANVALLASPFWDFAGNIDLSATGPGGLSFAFTSDPVVLPGAGTSQLTINGLGTLASGSHTVMITGDDGDDVIVRPVQLQITAAAPAVPAPTGPADDAVGVVLRPLLTWNSAADGIAYDVEVATDSAFTNVVFSDTTSALSLQVSLRLDGETEYFWRVRSSNNCGPGAYSAVQSFTTGPAPTILLVDDDNNAPNVLALYTAAMDAVVGAGAYEVLDTIADGEPDAGLLAGFSQIVWFSGDQFGSGSAVNPLAGPTAATEAVLGTWLDSGRCLLLSSQDYFFDRDEVVSSFMTNYLGVNTMTNDTGNRYTAVNGANVYAGINGALTFPGDFANWIDYVTPLAATGVQQSFVGSAGAGNGQGAGVSKLNAGYFTTFMPYPIENLPPATTQAVIQRFFDTCPISGNTPPTFTGEPYAFNVDEEAVAATVVGSVTATDVDVGQTLTYAITGGNTGNAFAIDGSTGQITVGTAAAVQPGTPFSLTVTVSDGANGSDSTTVTITVDEAVNDDPEFTSEPYAFSVDEEAILGTAVGTVAATDEENDPLAFAITGGNTGDAFAIDGSSGEITVLTPAAVQPGTPFSLGVDVTDGNGGLAMTTVTITVNNVNDAPVANPDAFAAMEDTPLVIAAPGVLDNDTDVDNVSLTATNVTQPANGSVALATNGSFTYTPVDRPH